MDTSSAAEMRKLIVRVQEEGASTAFQSVAVAAAQAFSRALKAEGQAAQAAISLAQREKLGEMLEELDDNVAELKKALNEQGRRLLTMTGEVKLAKPEASQKDNWWFALSEAIHRLEEDASWIGSLLSGQPSGAPARQLGELVVSLLQSHHVRLLAEAERWMP